jgi:hypothetical protein
VKTYAKKSSSKSDLTMSQGWMKPLPVMKKKKLTSFPWGNPFIQSKLRIGQPNDKYELEADRVADQVMGMPEPGMQRQTGCPGCKDDDQQVQTKSIGDQITPLHQLDMESEEDKEKDQEEDEDTSVQAKVFSNGDSRIQGKEEEPEAEEEEEEQEPVQIQSKSASSQTPKITPNLYFNIQSFKGSGQPLSLSDRNYFESRFGFDFSQVRIHSDTRAAETARSLNARAFTRGKDVVFGAGQYSPGTKAGRQLLAHELTHVVQQGNSNKTELKHNNKIDPDSKKSEQQTNTNLGSHPDGRQYVDQNLSITVVQTPMLQFSSIWEHLSNIPIIGWLVRAFRTEFSDKELYDYLRYLAQNNNIEDCIDSDNKARDIVRRWRRGEEKYNINKGFKGESAELSPVQLKILLIKEMLKGWISTEDEQAIFDILKGSDYKDLKEIFTPDGVSARRLKEDLHIEKWEKLKAYFISRFRGGIEWLEKGIVKVRLNEKEVVKLLNQHLNKTPPDKSSYFLVLEETEGDHANSRIIRDTIEEHFKAGKLNLIETWKAVFSQILGKKDNWPVELKNFLDGVQNGTFVLPKEMPPATRDSLLKIEKVPSRKTLLNYLDIVKKTIESNIYSHLKARHVVRLWKAHDPYFELTAIQKVNLIKEMLEGQTNIGDENAILDLLKNSSDADLEKILGKGGISYNRIKEALSSDSLKKLAAYRKQRISSSEKDIEEGTVKVRPKYITSSFKGQVSFHMEDPDRGWVKEKLKRGRRVELLVHPEEAEGKSASDPGTKSKFPKEKYYYVRITAGRHRGKVGYINKSNMFIPAKTSLLKDSKEGAVEFRPVSLVFFQNPERIQQKMEDIGAALTTKKTYLWEEDPGSPSTLKKKMSGKRIIFIAKDRKVYFWRKETFNFKKSKNARGTSSFYFVKTYIGSKGLKGYVDKSHLKSDIKKREGERDYFFNVAKKYVNRGGLHSIYVDPYSQKCEDRQYPIEYYSGSEIKQSIIGAKNCTKRLVTRIHIVAHGGPHVIAGYGDVWDYYGLYLKSRIKQYISRNKEMRGLTTEEFSRSLKNYLDKDVSIWLHACSTAKKHEVEDKSGGTKKVKGFAEELAQELRVFFSRATVRGFKTSGPAGRDPKGMVRYPK